MVANPREIFDGFFFADDIGVFCVHVEQIRLMRPFVAIAGSRAGPGESTAALRSSRSLRRSSPRTTWGSAACCWPRVASIWQPDWCLPGLTVESRIDPCHHQAGFILRTCNVLMWTFHCLPGPENPLGEMREDSLVFQEKKACCTHTLSLALISLPRVRISEHVHIRSTTTPLHASCENEPKISLSSPLSLFPLSLLRQANVGPHFLFLSVLFFLDLPLLSFFDFHVWSFFSRVSA